MMHKDKLVNCLGLRLAMIVVTILGMGSGVQPTLAATPKPEKTQSSNTTHPTTAKPAKPQSTNTTSNTTHPTTTAKPAKPQSTNTTQGKTTTSAKPILVLGSSGDAVKQLQTLLKTGGFYTGAIDGVLGRGTEAAVIKFQHAKGLKADGVVGAKTWAALHG